MKAASKQDVILFNETIFMLLPNLSHETLSMRWALKPLMSLHAKPIKYKWEFPFHVRAQHEGKTTIFQALKTFPSFIGIFELPQICLLEWLFAPPTPGLPVVPLWQCQQKKNKRSYSPSQRARQMTDLLYSVV